MKKILFLFLIGSLCFAVAPSKNSFNSGQISPLVDGRHTFTGYKSSVRTMENMLPATGGPAKRRPGTKYIATTPVSDIEEEPLDPNKIQLYTLEDIAKIGIEDTHPLDGDYELMNDLDGSIATTWNDGEGWNPIGSKYRKLPLICITLDPFTGTFDGRFHTIDGLYINAPASRGSYGFFLRIHEGIVENLVLTNIDYTASHVIGGMAAYVNSDEGAVIIRQCSVQGEIEGIVTGDLGGFVANVRDGVSGAVLFEKCYADVDITPTSPASWIGGFAGGVGFNDELNLIIRNCYATGDILGGTGSHDTGWGGFCGWGIGQEANPVLLFENCYSTGRVPNCSEEKRRGGFMGDDTHDNTIITSCYWDEETSECDWSIGGTGKTTAQMYQEATFVDWDFDDIWAIVEDVSYPTLQWVAEEVLSFPYTVITSEIVRLIPFEFSVDDVYVLALGDNYMGFYRTDADDMPGQIQE